jgi:hypothetical protein
LPPKAPKSRPAPGGVPPGESPWGLCVATIGTCDEDQNPLQAQRLHARRSGGDLLEHLGGTEDYLLAAELYEVALKRWPKVRIQMREDARIVYDNKRSVVV